jgi:hypothetical protein
MMNEEGNRLPQIIRRGSGAVVTLRRAQIVFARRASDAGGSVAEAVFGG